MVSFDAYPVIFFDTVLFKKGTLIKRAGVRTPWTPLLAPVRTNLKRLITSHKLRNGFTSLMI